METSAIAAKRRDQIMEAAIGLYEERGIERASVKDITAAAGITRSLFYHYFSSKEDVTQAILDRYIEGFSASIEEWNASRTEGDVRGALTDCVLMLRRLIFANDSFRLLLLKDENASLYLRFIQHASESAARYLTESTAEDYARLHTIEISHVYESFYLLVFGLIGYLRQHPEATDDLVADLIADTLHLDLGGGGSAADR